MPKLGPYSKFVAALIGIALAAASALGVYAVPNSAAKPPTGM